MGFKTSLAFKSGLFKEQQLALLQFYGNISTVGKRTNIKQDKTSSFSTQKTRKKLSSLNPKTRAGLKKYWKTLKLKDKYPPDLHFKEVESGKPSNRPELHKTLELCKKEKAVLILEDSKKE